jgi:formylglycine-generating enzyme required for sulfatase activity
MFKVKKWSVLLFIVGLCLALSAFAQDQPEQPPDKPPQTEPPKEVPKEEPKEKSPIYIYLKDGSRIVGEIKMDTVKVTTAYGVLTVPKNQVIRIKIGKDDDEVQTRKFTIRGTVQIEEFEITTKSGVLKVPKKDVKSISFDGSPDEFTNSIGMKFVLIQAGEFTMGSPENEEDHQGDETQHKVKMTRPFYMQTTEVTQAQWKAVMENNPSRFKGDDLPVEMVSWDDAQEFIKKLSAKESVKYRLPTEAEWEYACRAGSTTRFCFGDDESKLGEYAWYNKNSENKTHPVGTKKPNGWGLYDMHGNVWEWCQDWYNENYYKTSPPEDPQGPASSEYRVLRGGCWLLDDDSCRSADRWFGPSVHGGYIGFRAARSSE